MSTSYTTQTEAFKTIIDFLRFGLSCANEAGLFYGHGTDNAYDDIRALILRSLGLSHDTPELWLAGKLTMAEKQKLCQQLERRILERIPVPYLIHEAYFCGLPFYVDERVIIPRSPIAELIEQQFSPWVDPAKITNILDLCTGSGCIAIACCYAFPEATVDAVDISPEALEVAAINQKRHGVGNDLNLITSDCFRTIPKKRYDVIVSNPPYVAVETLQHLPAEYHHEPSMALEAADDGLAIVEQILTNAGDYLQKHGILIVEVGESQTKLVERFPEVPFTWLECERGGEGVFMLTYDQLKQFFSIG